MRIKKLTEAKRDDGRSGVLSPKTIKEYVSFISSVFDYGIKMGYAKENPCRSVTLPKPKKSEREVYTIEETQKLLQLLEKQTGDNFQYAVFFILAIFTGFRRGELLGLEWSDIDFENCTISVNRTSYYASGVGTYTDTPKTKGSQRTLKLDSDITALLMKYRNYQTEYSKELSDKWNETQRLFTAYDGKVLNPNSPYDWFKKFCKKNNFRQVSIHNLRHLNASILINAGVDVKAVQNALGHSSANTTLNIYAHTFQSAGVKVMQAVSETISLKATIPENND